MAIEIALNFDIHACTDITSFGIVDHSLEMAKEAEYRSISSMTNFLFIPMQFIDYSNYLLGFPYHNMFVIP